MSILHTAMASLAGHNLHLHLYCALGFTHILRASFALREHNYDDARDHGMHGVIYVLLGIL